MTWNYQSTLKLIRQTTAHNLTAIPVYIGEEIRIARVFDGSY